MEAGVINYKLCEQNYDCEHCSLHNALLEAYGNRNAPPDSTPRDKTMMKKVFPTLPAAARKCRYMLSGHVSYRLCHNQFQCFTCPFAQNIQDSGYELTYVPPWEVQQIDHYLLPAMLHFHRTHTWLQITHEGLVTVGVDDFAQSLLGTISAVRMSTQGSNLIQGDSTGFILDSSWGAVTILTPLSGRITMANEQVFTDPELINNDPYGKGWLFLLRPAQLEQDLKSLLYGVMARYWLADEAKRLHNFLKTKDKTYRSEFLNEFLICGE
jgi:glycine cleavage system H lipoate-binding protein